jgi:hypothetical protein
MARRIVGGEGQADRLRGLADLLAVKDERLDEAVLGAERLVGRGGVAGFQGEESQAGGQRGRVRDRIATLTTSPRAASIVSLWGW